MLAFKSLKKNRFKTILIYISMVISMSAIFLISAISSGVISMYSQMLKTDGDIIVTQKGIADTFFSDINRSLTSKIENIPNIKSIHALILGASPVDSLPIVGIYGMSQNRFDNYHLSSGEYPKNNQVMMGEKIYQSLSQPFEVEISKKIYEVSGVYKSDIGFEDGGVIMNIKDASVLFHKSSSIFLITLNDLAKNDSTIKKIESLDTNIEAKTTDSFVDNYNQFKIIQISSNAVASIAFFMGLLGIISLMSMIINERKNEFGIMRALGISSIKIIWILIQETLILSIIAFISAWAFSESILYLLKHYEKLQGYVNGEITITILVYVLVSSLLMAILGTLFPAFKASKTDPMILIQQGCQS